MGQVSCDQKIPFSVNDLIGDVSHVIEGRKPPSLFRFGAVSKPGTHNFRSLYRCDKGLLRLSLAFEGIRPDFQHLLFLGPREASQDHLPWKQVCHAASNKEPPLIPLFKKVFPLFIANDAPRSPACAGQGIPAKPNKNTKKKVPGSMKLPGGVFLLF
jgi:hypothetical protein